MSFTDADLARLKERLTVEHNCTDPVLNCNAKKALLARLEASENVCDMVEQTADIYTNMKVLKAVKAWRKSCGK